MTKKPKRPRLYDIVTGTRAPGQRDPLNQLMEEEARELASEARRLRLEEIIENRKRKLSRARQGSPIIGDDSNQLLNLMTMMNKQLETGVKIATNQTGGSKGDSTIEYLKLFNELLKQNQGGPGPTFFDQYLRGRELGIFGSTEHGNSNPSDVQIEKLRGERMLNSKRIDLELTKLRLEHEDGRDKLSALAQIASPFLAYTGAKMGAEMKERGLAVANRVSNPGTLQGETGRLMLSCDCGHSEEILVQIPPPEYVLCPKCNKQLSTGPAPEPESEKMFDQETGDQWP